MAIETKRHAGIVMDRLVDTMSAPVALTSTSRIADHDIPLITYDRDFRHFVHAGLKLL